MVDLASTQGATAGPASAPGLVRQVAEPGGQCLLCEAGAHNGHGQLLLRSDHFYLLAAQGPLYEGYLIIAPYRCDEPQPLRSFAQLSSELLQEALFLRGLAANFYRARYGQAGMHFEHGRSQPEQLPAAALRHHLHAHLCCYPVSVPFWQDIAYPTVEVSGLAALATMDVQGEYLFVQHAEVDETEPIHSAGRESWPAYVALLAPGEQLEDQYLRKLLARRLGVPERWDWASYPAEAAVRALCQDFRRWLSDQTHYVLEPEQDGVLRLRFQSSIARSNALGNDVVAEEYYQTWSSHPQHLAVARFLSHLPGLALVTDCERDALVFRFAPQSTSGPEQRPRVLDVGCGPGIYLKLFKQLGLQSVGLDISQDMLRLAAQVTGAQTGAPVRLVRMNALRPAFRPATFDGIWCSAMLVHLPKMDAPTALQALHALLKPQGVLYLSAQLGAGTTLRYEGRIFFYYGDDELASLLAQAGFKVMESWQDTSRRGTRRNKTAKHWQHYILSKPTDSEAGSGN